MSDEIVKLNISSNADEILAKFNKLEAGIDRATASVHSYNEEMQKSNNLSWRTNSFEQRNYKPQFDKRDFHTNSYREDIDYNIVSRRERLVTGIKELRKTYRKDPPPSYYSSYVNSLGLDAYVHEPIKEPDGLRRGDKSLRDDIRIRRASILARAEYGKSLANNLRKERDESVLFIEEHRKKEAANRKRQLEVARYDYEQEQAFKREKSDYLDTKLAENYRRTNYRYKEDREQEQAKRQNEIDNVKYDYEKEQAKRKKIDKVGAAIGGGIRSGVGAFSSFGGSVSSMSGATHFNYLDPFGYIGAAAKIGEGFANIRGSAGQGIMGIGGAVSAIPGGGILGAGITGIGAIGSIGATVSKMWFANFNAALGVVKGISSAIMTVIGELIHGVQSLFHTLSGIIMKGLGIGVGIGAGVAAFGIKSVSSAFGKDAPYYERNSGMNIADTLGIERSLYAQNLSNQFLVGRDDVANSAIDLSHKVGAFAAMGEFKNELPTALLSMVGRLASGGSGNRLKDWEDWVNQLAESGDEMDAAGRSMEFNALLNKMDDPVINKAVNRQREYRRRHGGASLFDRAYAKYDNATRATTEFLEDKPEWENYNITGDLIRKDIATGIWENPQELLSGLTGKQVRTRFQNLMGEIAEYTHGKGSFGSILGALGGRGGLLEAVPGFAWLRGKAHGIGLNFGLGGNSGAIGGGFFAGLRGDWGNPYNRDNRYDKVDWIELLGVDLRRAFSEGNWEPVFSRISEGILHVFERIGPKIATAWGLIGDVASGAGKFINKQVHSFFNDGTSDKVLAFTGGVAAGIAGFFKDLFSGDTITNAGTFFKTLGYQFLLAFEIPIKKLATLLDNIMETISSTFWTSLQANITGMNKAPLTGLKHHVVTPGMEEIWKKQTHMLFFGGEMLGASGPFGMQIGGVVQPTKENIDKFFAYDDEYSSWLSTALKLDGSDGTTLQDKKLFAVAYAARYGNPQGSRFGYNIGNERGEKAREFIRDTPIIEGDIGAVRSTVEHLYTNIRSDPIYEQIKNDMEASINVGHKGGIDIATIINDALGKLIKALGNTKIDMDARVHVDQEGKIKDIDMSNASLLYNFNFPYAIYK